MNINLSNADQKQVNKLLEVKENNITIANLLIDICLIRDDEFYKQIKFNFVKNNSLALAVLDTLQIDINEPTNKKLVDEYLANAFLFLDISKYEQNPYNLSVKPQQFKNKSYELCYEKYPAYSFFPLDDIKLFGNKFLECSSIGTVNKEYKYLCLKKNNEIWMCITPNEINTMDNFISEANGNVLTYGLGLGYFSFMCAIKENVKTVTVIESDKTIINLFLTYIYPFIPNKEKINIINNDAFAHYQNIKQGEYDYCFIDIWHDANDGVISFIKFKSMEHNYLLTRYWINESLYAMVRRCLLTIIEEQLNGVNPSIYSKTKNDNDRVINYLYEKTKTMSLNSYKDIVNLLTNKTIDKILK